MSDVTSREGWRWFGYPGHHIVSARCVFHLATLVGDGRYLVSTVGDYRPNGYTPKEQDTVGVGRNYETMVFRCAGVNAGGDPNVISWDGVDFCGYHASIDAERGHYVLCRKWDAGETTND